MAILIVEPYSEEFRAVHVRLHHGNDRVGANSKEEVAAGIPWAT